MFTDSQPLMDNPGVFLGYLDVALVAIGAEG